MMRTRCLWLACLASVLSACSVAGLPPAESGFGTLEPLSPSDPTSSATTLPSFASSGQVAPSQLLSQLSAMEGAAIISNNGSTLVNDGGIAYYNQALSSRIAMALSALPPPFTGPYPAPFPLPDPLPALNTAFNPNPLVETEPDGWTTTSEIYSDDSASASLTMPDGTVLWSRYIQPFAPATLPAAVAAYLGNPSGITVKSAAVDLRGTFLEDARAESFKVSGLASPLTVRLAQGIRPWSGDTVSVAGIHATSGSFAALDLYDLTTGVEFFREGKQVNGVWLGHGLLRGSGFQATFDQTGLEDGGHELQVAFTDAAGASEAIVLSFQSSLAGTGSVSVNGVLSDTLSWDATGAGTELDAARNATPYTAFRF